MHAVSLSPKVLGGNSAFKRKTLYDINTDYEISLLPKKRIDFATEKYWVLFEKLRKEFLLEMCPEDLVDRVGASSSVTVT